MLISKQNPIRANAATTIRYYPDRLLVADVDALAAEVIAVGVICRLVDPAPVIGWTGCECSNRNASDERRAPPALVPISAVPVALMPSQVPLMSPIDGGAARGDAGALILACVAMPCGEPAVRADAGGRKCAEVDVALRRVARNQFFTKDARSPE